MTEQPNHPGLAALGDMLGTAAHGDRWPDVKAANAAARQATAEAAARETRTRRRFEAAVNVFAALVAVLILAALAALAVAAWRWAL